MVDKVKNSRILVVDGQEGMCDMMTNMLREMGVSNVISFLGGNQAIRYLNQYFSLIDLVVCDWNVPEKDGLEILQELRFLRPDVPFLMVTGRTDMESVFEAQKMGVSGYLAKPFSLQDFEQKVSCLLQKEAA